MCGIVGLSANNKIDNEDISTIWMLAEERGGDGIGIYDGSTVFRFGNTVMDFFNHEFGINKIKKESDVYIGHTRKATFGTKNIENNHPFMTENHIGVHNGTINNYRELIRTNDLGLGSDVVDSKVFYELLNRKPLKKVLPLLEGTMAFAFVDRETKIINLYRFKKPLFIGEKNIGDTRAVYWASDEKWLNAIYCEKIKEIPEHTHIKIRNGYILSSKQLPDAIKPKTFTVGKGTMTYFHGSGTNNNVNSGLRVIHPKVADFPFTAKMDYDSKLKSNIVYWFESDGTTVVYYEDDKRAYEYKLSTTTEINLLKIDAPGTYETIVTEWEEAAMNKSLVDDFIK